MAIMFDHAVKYNGKFYPANTPIEEPSQEPEIPAQEPEQEQDKEEFEEQPETARKGGRGRKNGDS